MKPKTLTPTPSYLSISQARLIVRTARLLTAMSGVASLGAIMFNIGKSSEFRGLGLGLGLDLGLVVALALALALTLTLTLTLTRRYATIGPAG